MGCLVSPSFSLTFVDCKLLRCIYLVMSRRESFEGGGGEGEVRRGEGRGRRREGREREKQREESMYVYVACTLCSYIMCRLLNQLQQG